MREIHVAFASDEGYSLQLRVAVGSLVAACGEVKSEVSLIVHVLDCGLTDDTWALFRSEIGSLAQGLGEDCQICRHEIPMDLFKRFPLWHSSRATYARLLLPEILPEVKRCIYSDCDVLFLKAPVDILLQLEKRDVAIVGHSNPPDESGTSVDWRWFEKVHEPYCRETYFCAGLIGMDLEKFRSSGAVEKILSFLAQHADAVAPDQCALNWFFREDSAILKHGWGVWPEEIHLWDGLIGAIHYIGGRPWKDFSWYEYVMERDVNNLWRDMCRRITGVDGYSRLARQKGVCLGVMVRIAAFILGLFSADIPRHPKFMKTYLQTKYSRKRIWALHEQLFAEHGLM